LHKIFNVLGTPNESIWPDFKNLPHAKKARVALRHDVKHGARLGHHSYWARTGLDATVGSQFIFETQPYNQLSAKMRNTKITEAGLDLLNGLLTYDPAQRLTAEQVRLHAIAAPTAAGDLR